MRSRGLAIGTLCLALILAASASHAEREVTAAQKELHRRLESLQRRVALWEQSVESLIQRCGTCTGTGKLRIRGQEYRCSKCGGSGAYASKMFFRKLRWDFMSPEFRARPNARALYEDEYDAMIKSQRLPYSPGRAQKTWLVDASHGVSERIVNEADGPSQVRWVYSTNTSRGGVWYVWSGPEDGAWPQVDRHYTGTLEDDETTGPDVRSQTALLAQINAIPGMHHVVADIVQEDLALTIHMGRLIALATGETAEAAIRRDCVQVLAALRRLPASERHWSEVTIRFQSGWKDRFGRIEMLPDLDAHITAEDLDRIWFDNLSVDEVWALLKVDAHRHPDSSRVYSGGEEVLAALNGAGLAHPRVELRCEGGVLTVALDATMKPERRLPSDARRADATHVLRRVAAAPGNAWEWSVIEIRFLDKWRDKFGRTALLPYEAAALPRESLEKIVFDNLTFAEVWELMSKPQLDHEGWVVLPPSK